jgi:hypothetical protein
MENPGFSFVTQSNTNGPNVILNSNGDGNSSLQPHQRWATGLLIDNFQSGGGSIDLLNRASGGGGQGWAIAWGVVWNSQAIISVIQSPPGTFTIFLLYVKFLWN